MWIKNILKISLSPFRQEVKYMNEKCKDIVCCKQKGRLGKDVVQYFMNFAVWNK